MYHACPTLIVKDDLLLIQSPDFTVHLVFLFAESGNTYSKGQGPQQIPNSPSEHPADWG